MCMGGGGYERYGLPAPSCSEGTQTGIFSLKKRGFLGGSNPRDLYLVPPLPRMCAPINFWGVHLGPHKPTLSLERLAPTYKNL